jgi:hypothetical protein
VEVRKFVEGSPSADGTEIEGPAGQDGMNDGSR